MEQLSTEQIEMVGGGKVDMHGTPREWVDAIEYFFERLPIIYDKAINGTSEMMCRATKKC